MWPYTKRTSHPFCKHMVDWDISKVHATVGREECCHLLDHLGHIADELDVVVRGHGIPAFK